jgi:glutamine---fructose-6-phosphate transaminase (isomerizing)
MCGIFGYVGEKNTAPKIVLDGLKRLEYRGYDSWGVAVVPTQSDKQHVISEKQNDNIIVVKKKAGKIGAADVNNLPPGTLAFGHTRWATHGGVTDKNAHPHLDCTHTIAVIHNGIVENYEQLKKKLIEKGHIFISETDTEVIAHQVEEYAKTMMFSKAVQKTFNDLEGLNAIILLNTKDHQMIAARNGSPLVVGFGTNENYLASDPAALVTLTKQVHFLEDFEMAIIEERSVHIYDAQTGIKIRPRKQRLTWTTKETEKGKFPFFMLKEIYEQPGLLSEIAAESMTQAELMAGRMQKANHVYFIGSGTSGHAALAATYLFADIAHLHVNWSIASECANRIDVLDNKSIVVALSQSGETMDLLEPMQKAKAKGIPVFALVNVVGSSLWRMSDLKLPIGAGPEKGVASTKAFTAKVAHMLLMAYALKDQVKVGQSLLLKAAKATQDILKPDTMDKIMTLAKNLKNATYMFVIGRGISYPTALESALKIKEISYIHAEGVAAGELKHGPLALVTKGLPCIVYAPNDEHYNEHINAATELKARGGHVIGLSHKPNTIFDDYIPVPDCGLATIIPNVMVGQLLAYYLTIERGFDPDMPRNLAKSVTVK